MSTIYREFCCLILDYNTLTVKGDVFTGVFIPANPKTTNWLQPFDAFLKRSFADPETSDILVAVGPMCGINEKVDLSLLIDRIDGMAEYTGLIIVSADRLEKEDRDNYRIQFKFMGSRAKVAKKRLMRREPFILATMSRSNDSHECGAIIRTITKVLGLELLARHDLELLVPDEIIEKCSFTETLSFGLGTTDPEIYTVITTPSVTTTDNLTNQTGIVMINTEKEVQPAELKQAEMEEDGMQSSLIKTISVDANAQLSHYIIQHNTDMAETVRLNLAAGNFIDHTNDETALPEVYEKNIRRQLNIDASECGELWEAYVAGDVSLFRDALADKAITLNGFQNILPFSMTADYRAAVANNFTRFDLEPMQAFETQAKYKAIGVKTDIFQIYLTEGETATTYLVNKVSEDCVGTDGNEYAKGKWVKSKYFTNDSFAHIVGMLSMEVDDITRRYTETRGMLKDLIKRIDKVFIDTIGELKD